MALDVAALILLAISAKLAHVTHQGSDLLFLGAALLGLASGYRVAGAAFRRGRRRHGRDPEPSPPGILRFLGGFTGFWIKLILGFAFWALLWQFFKRY